MPCTDLIAEERDIQVKNETLRVTYVTFYVFTNTRNDCWERRKGEGPVY